MARSPHQLSCLTSLSLDFNRFGKEGARALFSALQAGACPSIQELHIDQIKIEDEGLMSFAAALEDGMPCSNSLRVIDFQKCNVGVSGLKALFHVMAEKGALPNIEKILFMDNRLIADEDVAEMVSGLERGAARKLQSLSFQGVSMTDVGARLLGKALATKALPPSLREIGFDCPRLELRKLTDEGRNAIKEGLQEGGWLKNPSFKCWDLHMD